MVHFGLGATLAVDSVRVRWPDGSEQEFGAREGDSLHVLERDSDR